MGRSGWSSAAWVFAVLWIVRPGEALGQHRVSIEPSMEIVEVHDDNLFVSADNPVGDFILRVSPTLALRFDSPRWQVAATYGVDGTRFATHRGLDNSRARERSLIDLHYRAGPRLTLEFEGTYMDTDNAAELNLETGLAASRLRAQRLTFRPSAHFRISPRLSAHTSLFSTTEKLNEGPRMRAQFKAVGLERQVTPRDLFTVDYEHGNYVFEREATTSTTNTYVLLAGWTRELGPGTRLMLRAGPRITDDSPAAELFASLTHRWRLSSMTLSGLQTQTTIVGFPDTVETRSLEARFTYTPTRLLTAYAAPAVFRSVRDDLEATVYRIGLGARYSLTPLVGLEVSYGLDSQHGAIEPLRAHDEFSHGTLSVGLTARWNTADRSGGPMR